MNSLRILLLNIRSLRRKVDDLTRTVELHSPDVICINETWLDETVSDSEVAIPGFSVLRSDRKGRVGGGVCMYYRSTLPLRPRPDIAANGVECCFGEIPGRPACFVIGTVYRPPSETVQYWDLLDAVLLSAVRPNSNLVLCGDFNINIERNTEPQLSYLTDLASSYNLHQSVSQATRFGLHGTSTIDLMFNTFDTFNSSTVIPVAYSDHAAVLSRFEFTPTLSPTSTNMYRNYSRINLDEFRSDLIHQNFCNIPGSPSEMWSEWSARFLRVLNVHAPLLQRRDHKKKTVPWMDRQLLYLLSRRNRLHRKWLDVRTDQFYEEFATARREATSYNRALKEAYYRERFQECSGSSKRTWRMIKELTGRQQVTKAPQCTVDEIQATFAKIVDDQSRPPSLNIPEGPLLPGNFQQFQPVSIAKIRRLLERLNPRKATGSDEIPAALLRSCADILAPSLSLLFNRSLAHGCFPDEMKIGTIRPLFKGGDPSQPRNYRPVSLLPVVSKVLERLVHEQLSDYLTRHSLIPDTQFGYRKHHSTSDALLLAVEGISQARAAHLHTGIAFVDMSKAFDKVQHQTLIYDLFNIGISGSVLRWLANYLSGRHQYVQVGMNKSNPYASSSGVPQGSVLGPLLFVIYVREISTSLNHFHVNTVQFADDISLRASCTTPVLVSQRLTAAVQYLADWLRRRGLILNEAKTQILSIAPQRGQSTHLYVRCNSQLLPLVESAKYLGLFFDSDMTWNTMIDHIARRIGAKIAVLLRYASSLPFSCRISFFRCFILTDFLYASNAYASYLSATQEQRLGRLFNRAVRAVCRAPPWSSMNKLLAQINVYPLHVYIQSGFLCFIWRCLNNAASKLFVDYFKTSRSARTRGSCTKLLIVPLATSSASSKQLTHVGALLWNSLPPDTRTTAQIGNFKFKVLNHIVPAQQ